MVSAVNHRTLLPAFASLIVVVLGACGDDAEPAARSNGGADGGVVTCPAVAPAPVAANACNAKVWSAPPVENNALHVADGTPVSYCTNPPTTGPHYFSWADFREYDKEIDARYLVHSMEHGAVILYYRCDGGAAGCPEIVDALRALRDARPVDPICAQLGSTQRRIILAPSPAIPTKVAAAAWGGYYEADCVDPPTLDAFLNDYYAKTIEDICVPGESL